MKRGFIAALAGIALLTGALPGLAQAPRKDVVWARSTAGALITVDGVLNEPAWLAADSVHVQWGMDSGIPGSGWKPEAGILPTDPTFATLKFLTVADSLYVSFFIKDKSVGGSNLFNRFDGLLMALKDHLAPNRPSPPSEYFYTWWYPEDSIGALMPGRAPVFRGRWTGCSDSPTPDCTRPRTDVEKAAWDAATTVFGISNDDNNVDANPSDNDDGGYIVEMKFGLKQMGYNITQSQGDIVEWNVSIYDTDWFWPFQPILSANRVWFENPWGNAAWYHNVRIHCRPNVTISSGVTPTVGPEVRIPTADNFTAPTINGTLTEPVWAAAKGFKIKFGDANLRNTYPAVGPYRSGEYQFSVNGGLAPVIDPGEATVKVFFKGDNLYLGFDVIDQSVQYYTLEQRWDGFIVSLTEYSARHVEDHQLLVRPLSFQVCGGTTPPPPPACSGNVLAQGYLPYLRDTLAGAQVALALKPGTVLDTTGAVPDFGYTAELRVDLTKLGYPAGRGDGRIFMGVSLLDGDCFTPFTDSYSTRTWYFREYEGPDGAGWGYLDPTLQVETVSVDDMFPNPLPAGILLGNSPNPFRDHTEIRLALDGPRHVKLEVFDLAGRRVASQSYGQRGAGDQVLRFRNPSLNSGLYLYRVRLADVASGRSDLLEGRMLVVQ